MKHIKKKKGNKGYKKPPPIEGRSMNREAAKKMLMAKMERVGYPVGMETTLSRASDGTYIARPKQQVESLLSALKIRKN